MTEFIKGDVVHLRATVKFQTDGGHVYLEVGHSSVSVEAASLIMIRPELEPGAKVDWSGVSMGCKVLGQHGDRVWLEMPEGCPGEKQRIAPVSELKRVALPGAAPIRGAAMSPAETPIVPPSETPEI